MHIFLKCFAYLIAYGIIEKMFSPNPKSAGKKKDECEILEFKIKKNKTANGTPPKLSTCVDRSTTKIKPTATAATDKSTPTSTATDPPPANSITKHSRLVCQIKHFCLGIQFFLVKNIFDFFFGFEKNLYY